MKFGIALLAILAIDRTDAFFAGQPKPFATQVSFNQHDTYMYSLTQKMGMIQEAIAKVGPQEAAQMMDKEIQVTQTEHEEAEIRRSALEQTMQAKIAEQTANDHAMQKEIEKQAFEFNNNFNTASEVAMYQTRPSHNNQAIISEYKAREEALQKEMHILAAKLKHEEDHIRANQDVMNRMLETRIQADKELSQLKKVYAADNSKWQSELQAQRQAHNRDVTAAQREVDQLRQEIQELKEANLNAHEMSSSMPTDLEEKLMEAQLISDRVIENRNEINGELEALKLKYESDRAMWSQKLDTEVSAHEEEVTAAKAEVETLRKKIEKMEIEYDNGALEAKLKEAQEISDRIMASRNEIDGELGALKQKYEHDSAMWAEKMRIELSARDQEITNARAEVKELKTRVEKMVAEHKDIEILEEKLKKAQVMSDQMVMSRNEIEGELGALQRKYEDDRVMWSKKFVTEVSARDKEVANAKAELEKLQVIIEKMEAERNDAGSLFTRSLKVMFGGVGLDE